jgi:hypothetical protein
MDRSIPITIAIAALLAACQPVPSGQSRTDDKPRPIKPLPAETMTVKVAEPEPIGGGFKVAKVGEKPTAKPSAPAAKPAGQAPKLSPAELQEKFQEAEDKAMSAASLQNSAQSKDDWNLVFERWKKAIALITPIAGQSPQLKQRLAEYQRNLSVATQEAQESLNPKAKPVQESGGKPMIVRTGEDPQPPGKAPEAGKAAGTPANPADKAAPGSPANPPPNPAPPKAP